MLAVSRKFNRKFLKKRQDCQGILAKIGPYFTRTSCFHQQLPATVAGNSRLARGEVISSHPGGPASKCLGFSLGGGWRGWRPKFGRKNGKKGAPWYQWNWRRCCKTTTCFQVLVSFSWLTVCRPSKWRDGTISWPRWVWTNESILKKVISVCQEVTWRSIENFALGGLKAIASV